MNDNLIKNFWNCGCFIGIPSENKIYVMTHQSDFKNNECILNPPYFYLNDFYMNHSSPYFKGEVFFEISYSEMLKLISKEFSEKPQISWNELSKKNYINQFESIKNAIDTGYLKKGVPYSSLNGQSLISTKNKVYLIKSLLENKNQNSTYIYGYWNQFNGFIGSTPELLFIQNDCYVQTIALAGTVPNAKNVNKEAFVNNQKMQKEHLLVIEGLKHSLSQFGMVSIGETKILELPKLIHLKTDILVKLKENFPFQFEKFLKEIHPTAAVGSLPKNSQGNWLPQTKEEILNRGYYAAPFGIILDENNSICICTIRGMQWQDNIVKICAGGGVILESDINLEWQEIESKMDAIKYSLGL
ncbi:chorismate-binding protein [Silvanigrella aquatica]|uniref:Chorismate-utilising enzyme C-terminal domain-containing protein n=1 Tax=Silvanigrella aquatica TaxID=1915309 RepID=A0A1L4D438_9BACT|nr:chorismate-binding protein [Silvanigrella aquatica]APJ04950.1 hypothetical protein AXG55_14015 [Silvanigrella aquatica]